MIHRAHLHVCALLALLLASTVVAADNHTEHVVIVMMDGARLSETWGDASHKYIPRIAAEIAPQGVVLTQFLNRGPTNTNPGHAAVCTGLYQGIDNSGKELPLVPGLFQYLRRDCNIPENGVWVVASKDKLWVLSDTQDPAWTGKYRPSFDCGVDHKGGGGYRTDRETMDITTKVLTTYAPTAIIINFLGPDSNGHAKNWRGYLEAIREVDGYVADLWKTIQNEPLLKDKTALFLTNDHGRHLDHVRDGFVSHGCSCAGCRNIMCIAIGPDFKRGVEVNTPYQQTDIAVTAGYLLKVTIPSKTGKLMKDLFIHPPQ